MEVIPLTLAISLLLSLTFIGLFVREFSRPRRAGAEHESLLPLEPEGRAVGAGCGGHPHAHSAEAEDEACGHARADKRPCGSCRRRRARLEARAAAGLPAPTLATGPASGAAVHD